MTRDNDTSMQSEAYETASMRYMVDPAESTRLGDRMAELDSVYDTELRRLGAMLASARKKLFRPRSAGKE